MGLCNSPATFDPLVEWVLEGLLHKKSLVYLDDVIVYGKLFEKELEKLKDVCNLWNLKKCTLFWREVALAIL